MLTYILHNIQNDRDIQSIDKLKTLVQKYINIVTTREVCIELFLII